MPLQYAGGGEFRGCAIVDAADGREIPIRDKNRDIFYVFCDKNSVVNTSCISKRLLKKKHLKIEYNIKRKSCASLEIEIRYIKYNNNHSNPFTTPVTTTDLRIMDDIFSKETRVRRKKRGNRRNEEI